ncbi:hypothetical protein M8J76_000994 [Diaphorina citri]|nr:hypothetical protein M8J76_000994 [Diaphorina citri]
MRYPSCFVLVTEMDSPEPPPAAPTAAPGAPSTPSGGVTVTVVPHHTHHPASMVHPPPPAITLPEVAWQECTLETSAAGGAPTPGPAGPGTPPAPGSWPFTDPTLKKPCACAKCRKGAGSVRTTFHRRPLDGSSTAAHNRPHHQPSSSSTPHHGGAGGGGDSSVPPISPPSIGPSPLPGQPASVPPCDVTMPVLSPQHTLGAPPPSTPTPLLDDKLTGGGARTPSSVSNQVFSPYTGPLGAPPSVEGGAGGTPGIVKTEPADSSMLSSSSTAGPGGSGPGGNQSGSGNTNSSDQAATNTYVTLKRPVLQSRDYEECLHEDDGAPSKLLYDYSTLDAWLNHPVKRFKPSEPRVDPPTRGPSGSVLMGGTPHYRSPSPPQFIKQETGTNSLLHPATGQHETSDPYNFDDEGPNSGLGGPNNSSGASLGMDFKRGLSGPESLQIKEEDVKNSSNNLYTNEGLVPTYKDLENMFENSDDNGSSDEATLQVPTPPGSNKPASAEDSGNNGGTTASGASTAATLLVRPPRGSGGVSIRPEELSKMFPTPPSLENHPMASPSGHFDTPTHDSLSDYTFPGAGGRVKQEIYPNMGSPVEEVIEDWSYVFRPPPLAKMVGSSKYAPLTNLPSQSLPPLTLPPNCVYKPTYLQSFPTGPGAQGGQSGSNNTASPASQSGPNSNVDIKPNMLPNPSSSSSSRGAPTPGPGRSPYPPSPMMWGGSYRARTPCAPPPPYSPATPSYKPTAGSEPLKDPPGGRPPEANALVVNILLGDTLLNIFRDHNFDSCTLCVCSTDPKCVGNIKGADAGIYLPSSSTGPGAATNGASSNLGISPASPFTPSGSNGGNFLHNNNSQDEDPIRCSCGFSAVVNRRLSHRSGLFLEDELEITGISEEPPEKDDLNNAGAGVIDLMREQCNALHSSSNSLLRAARSLRSPSLAIPSYNVLELSDTNQVTHIALDQGRLDSTVAMCRLSGRERPIPSYNVLELSDTNQVTHIALDQGRLDSTVAMCKVEEMAARQQQLMASVHCGSGGPNGRCSVHRWPYLRARGPRCNQDIIRVMTSLQPLLQDAVQKKCTTRLWEAPYTVSGPLTWRQFHRLAGRGTDDRCEPQPIPSVLVGHEKDWLALSPYALHHWDKLLLEPYSYSRDVAYIVVAPDSEYILTRTRQYFKELSSAYEVCRLGRHCPITKVLRDGILRVGKTAALKLAKEPVDEWFSLLGDSSTAGLLKLYAQVCRHYLAPQLSTLPLDRTLLDPPESPASTRPHPSPMSSTLDSASSDSKAPSTPKSEHDSEYSRGADSSGLPGAAGGSNALGDPSSGLGGPDDDQCEPPAIVIYLVDPFTLVGGTEGGSAGETQRLACLGLLRCYSTVLAAIPDSVRANISVQIVSLESILELGKAGERRKYCDEMRATALSVFSQCRRQLSHTTTVKALTGFGTAAMTDLFLKTKDEKNRAPYKVYTPPYILSKSREKSSSNSSELTESPSSSYESCVMYVSYCLSEDQKWLLAGITDQQGVILETATINIYIPNRTRRKKNPARRFGLQKLMDFILGVMSQSTTPWRLVVGRVGRIGHGELKGWSGLLSRKALQRASRHLREICAQCALPGTHSLSPAILSASLVSLEPDSSLRVMPQQFTPDTRFSPASVHCPLSTPQDVSCTHILVFPTSATTQSSQNTLGDDNAGFGDGGLFGTSLIDEVDPDGIVDDFYDIFANPEDPGYPRSPTGRDVTDSSSQPGSPSLGLGGATNDPSGMFHCNGQINKGLGSLDTPEEIGTLLQQPLALGYFVSTAPTGRLPRWFWSSCPHLEAVCPAFLKSALHMHTSQQYSEDLLQQATNTPSHPLDSTITTDVLRYVLEGYNALSWLAMDSNTHDRLSCLPIHIQALMQLYHMTCTLL